MHAHPPWQNICQQLSPSSLSLSMHGKLPFILSTTSSKHCIGIIDQVHQHALSNLITFISKAYHQHACNLSQELGFLFLSQFPYLEQWLPLEQTCQSSMNFSFVHFAVAALYYHLFIQMCLATSGTRTLYNVGWTLDKAMAATRTKIVRICPAAYRIQINVELLGLLLVFSRI